MNENDTLATLGALRNITVLDRVQMGNNPVMTDVGLDELRTVTGDFQIFDSLAAAPLTYPIC